MTVLSKRSFLLLGGAAIAAVAGVGYATSGTQTGAGFEHRFLTVDDMQAAGALIVDIRTPQEWRDTGVIDGAKLVTFRGEAGFADTFTAALGDELDAGRNVVLICRSGNRTQAAARALSARISNPVISVEGGMRKLMASGYRPVPPT